MTDERTRKAAYRLAARMLQQAISESSGFEPLDAEGRPTLGADGVLLAVQRIALALETAGSVEELTVAAEVKP